MNRGVLTVVRVAAVFIATSRVYGLVLGVSGEMGHASSSNKERATTTTTATGPKTSRSERRDKSFKGAWQVHPGVVDTC